MKTHSIIINKADNIAKTVLEISAIALFAMMLTLLVYALLVNNLLALSPHATTILTKCFKTIAVAVLCVFLLSVVVRMLLSPFVKSDDEREFQSKIDYILQQKSQSKKRARQNIEIASVLVNLTPPQEAAVCRLLKDLPSHAENPDRINMAMVSQYLTALRDLGYLKDNDTYNLYAWVGEVTNKQMPDYNHFNEAYPSRTVGKVRKAKETISASLYSV